MKNVLWILLAIISSSCSQVSSDKGRPMMESHRDMSKRMLSDVQLRLANVKTTRLVAATFGDRSSTVGKIIADEKYSSVVSARLPGRIEKLFVKEKGQFVQQGEPMFSLYSEALLTLEEEYVFAKQRGDSLNNTLLKRAGKKLSLYGLTERQIQSLNKRSSITPSVIVYAPRAGWITTLFVKVGDYVEEGESLLKLDDFQHTLIEAELFISDASSVKVGDKVRVRVSDGGDESATVIFISSAVNSNEQTINVRALLGKSNASLKPGEKVEMFFGGDRSASTTVPSDAVIHDADDTFVFVQSGKNVFERRSITAGEESFDTIEVIRGLQESDTVVVSGVYLLNSEFILRNGRHSGSHH